MDQLKKGFDVLGVEPDTCGLGFALLEHVEPPVHLKYTGSEFKLAMGQALHNLLSVLDEVYELGVDAVKGLTVGTQTGGHR
jgi:hypothetical protein